MAFPNPMARPRAVAAWLAQGTPDVPAGDSWLAGGEGRDSGTPKRRAERRLRRWTAKRALALHLRLPDGPDAMARLEIRHEPGGAPQALLDGQPVGAALSVTDRAGRAVCAVASAGIALGCDLELIEPRSAAFSTDFLTAAEQRFVAAGDGDERHVRANLVWCAKEATLKALGTGLRRDTRSVEVNLPSGGRRSEWQRLDVTAAEGARFEGWWRRDGAFLLAVVADRALAPPVGLLAPPALERVLRAE
jgi:4'-phosphopantetheinyl transferase